MDMVGSQSIPAKVTVIPLLFVTTKGGNMTLADGHVQYLHWYEWNWVTNDLHVNPSY